MSIDKQQRVKNTYNKNQEVANSGTLKGLRGVTGRVPQSGAVARATYETAHDMGSSDRASDPVYAEKSAMRQGYKNLHDKASRKGS
jgi:hypothetical protein